MKREVLEKKLARLETAEAQTQGAIGQLLKQLKQDFSCKGVEAARAKLEEISEAQIHAQVAYDEKLEEFQTQFGDLLE